MHKFLLKVMLIVKLLTHENDERWRMLMAPKVMDAIVVITISPPFAADLFQTN
jgi:hypothetical protein